MTAGYPLGDGATALRELPTLAPDDFHAAVVAACQAGARLVALTVIDGGHELLAVLARKTGDAGDDNDEGAASSVPDRLEALRMSVPGDRRYPSLTAQLPEAQGFERELAEEFALLPEGHPWLKPLRRHRDLEAPGTPDPHPFFAMAGDGVHEVAVGPVHAGIIEPGHFRFQCYGETVHSLEIQLGYQRRGAERLLVEATPARRMAVAESVAGDTSIGHGLAHVTLLEKLAGVEAPAEATRLRAIALEIERIDSHTGDLGALAGDVGYQPGAAWYGRLRGDFLNLLIELSGNRFGRGLLCPGGVRATLPFSERAGFRARFDTHVADFERIAEVMFDAPSVVSRFEGTGQLDRRKAAELGLVGPVARACGLTRDARRDLPEGVYRSVAMPVATRETGDVMARAEVRRAEVGLAAAFVRARLAELGDGPLARTLSPRLQPSSLAVATIEGWRGEIAHLATTSADGRLASYKIVDPSFHNWFGLAMALRDGQISDFPLCNKSFNLSYAGHDL